MATSSRSSDGTAASPRTRPGSPGGNGRSASTRPPTTRAAGTKATTSKTATTTKAKQGSRSKKAAKPKKAAASVKATTTTSTAATSSTRAAKGGAAAGARRTSGKAGRSPVSEPVVVGTRRPIGGRAPAAWVERLFAPPNVDGPRVRTGIAWFILAVPAVWYGKFTTAALFGLVALVAALQSGQAWNRAGYRTSRLVAALGAIAIPAAALLPRPATAGIVVAAVPLVALLAAMLAPVRRRRVSSFAAAGATVCSCVPGAIAAAGMIAVADLGRPTALTLLALVSAYEVGSFVFGAESPYPSHAILVGAICTMTAVAPIWVFRLQPFDGRIDAWIFGGMVAVFAPLGSIVASAALPTASTWVPALRRLDAYIVAAPLWASAMWTYLAA